MMGKRPGRLNFLNYQLGYTREFVVELSSLGAPLSLKSGLTQREWVDLTDGRKVQADFRGKPVALSFGRRSEQQEVRRWIREARRPWLASLEVREGEVGLEGVLRLSRTALTAELEEVPEILLTEDVIQALGRDFKQAQSAIIKNGGVRDLSEGSRDAVVLMMELPIHLRLEDRERADEVKLFLSNERTLVCRIEGVGDKRYLVATACEERSAEERRTLRNAHFVSASKMPKIVEKEEDIRGGKLLSLMPISSPELTAWLEYEGLFRDRQKALLEQRQKVDLEFDEVVGAPKKARSQDSKRSWKIQLKNRISDCEKWLAAGESFGGKAADITAFVEIRSLGKEADQKRPPAGTLLKMKQDGERIMATLEVEGSIRLPEKGKLIVRPHPGDEAQERRRDGALGRLVGAQSPNPDLLRYLLFPKTISEISGRNTHLRHRPGGPRLNTSQRQAVIRASKEPGIMLIQGPPGTGKTTVISEIIHQMRHRYRNKESGEAGQERTEGALRVLVSSIQNDAVANAADKLGGQEVFVDRHIRGEEENISLELGGRAIAKKLWKQMEGREAFERYRRLCELERALGRLIPNISEAPTELAKYLQELKESPYFVEFGRSLQTDFQSLEAGLEQVISEEALLAQAQDEGEEDEEQLPADLQTVLEGVLKMPEELIVEDLKEVTVLIEELRFLIREGTEAVRVETFELDGLASSALRRLNRALQRQELDGRARDYWKELRQETDRLLFGEEEDEEEVEEEPSPRELWFEEMRAWVERARQYLADRLAEDGASEEAILFDWISALNDRPQDMVDLVANYAPVRAATCQVSERFYEEEKPYDMVIIDEAARGGIDVLIPMTMGRSVVLIGDQNQLPPHIEQELEHQLDEQVRREVDLRKTSIFSYLWEAMGGEAAHQNCVALETQYRMHRDIGEVVSKVFYEPHKLRLKHHCEGGRDALRAPRFGLLNDEPFVWVDTSDVLQDRARRTGCGSWPYTMENPYEVALIVKMLKGLSADDEALERLLSQVDLERGEKAIGVIPFYQGQRDLLERALRREVPELREHIELGTADSFQGKDFPLIFLSTVRSNLDGRVGFLDLPNRFNVGISRAKNQAIFLGDSKTLASAKGGSRPAKQIWELVKSEGGPGKVVMSRDI